MLPLTLTLAALAAAPPGVPLVAGGRARAAVVVPDDPASGTDLRLAAEELAGYVRKATGATLPVVREADAGGLVDLPARVWLGPCKANAGLARGRPLEPEEYVIKAAGDAVHVLGGDRLRGKVPVRGTLNATYVLIEEALGVRWLFPGELGEVVPRAADLAVPAGEARSRPKVALRKVRDSVRAGYDTKVKPYLEELGVDPAAWQEAVGEKVTGPWFRRQRLGGRTSFATGHSFAGFYEKFGREHPDYFALQPDGTRKQVPVRETLCMSNPGLWDLVARLRSEELAAHPELEGISVALNDGGKNAFCMCDACRALDPPGAPKVKNHVQVIDPATKKPYPEYPSLTDRTFRFFNEVARRVGKDHPDRFLVAYAYSAYRDPPVATAKLEPNLLVGYVGVRRDYITAWSKLASRLIVRPNELWPGQEWGLPRNAGPFLADTVKFAYEHKCDLFDFDGCVGNWGTHGLSYYLLAKALWDPYVDVAAATADYCRAAYGPAAGPMRAYHDRLRQVDERLRASDLEPRDDHPEKALAVYTPGLRAELRGLLEEAKASAAGDRAVLARIGMAETGLGYADRVCAVLAAGPVKSPKQLAAVKQRNGELAAYLRENALGVTLSTGHDYRYFKNALTALEVQAKRAKQDED